MFHVDRTDEDLKNPKVDQLSSNDDAAKKKSFFNGQMDHDPSLCCFTSLYPIACPSLYQSISSSTPLPLFFLLLLPFSMTSPLYGTGPSSQVAAIFKLCGLVLQLRTAR